MPPRLPGSHSHRARRRCNRSTSPDSSAYRIQAITIVLPEGDDTMNEHLLDRRQFSLRCAAFGLSFLAAEATAQVPVPAPGAAAKPAARTVRLPDGTTVPALGQGCWH